MFRWFRSQFRRLTCFHRYRYGLGPGGGHPFAYTFDDGWRYLEPYWCVKCGKQVARRVDYVWASWERE